MTKHLLDAKDEKRLEQDEKTLVAMARIYCYGHHHISRQSKALCLECSSALAYSLERTRKCPQKHRGTCDTCQIQCYKPAMREKIRTIMAYSGPRMIAHHPVMALRHLYRKQINKRGQL